MAKRGGFPGGMGMPGNMNNLMKQAQKMQKQMEENQKALEEKEFTATAGGGAVEVTVTGGSDHGGHQRGAEEDGSGERGGDVEAGRRTGRRLPVLRWSITAVISAS